MTMRYRCILTIAGLLLAGSAAGAQDLQESASIDLADGVILHLKAAPYDAALYPLTEKDGVLIGIGDCPPVGTDGPAPQTMLTEANLQVGSTVVPLDVSCMFNPWFRSPHLASFTAQRSGEWIWIRGGFSDGAGSYLAEWMVVGVRSVRTMLTSDIEIISDLLYPER